MGRKKDNVQINNIADLRRHAINTLDMLCNGDIEVEDAKAASDLYKDVLGTVKIEMDYNRLIGKAKQIKFCNGEESVVSEIDAEQIKRLENKWTGN